MTEHTPGPWQYYEDDASLYYIVFKPHVGAIAQVYSEANARLIVTAINAFPALLEALDFYANEDSWMPPFQKLDWDYTEPLPVLDDGGDKARAALAAARQEPKGG